MTNEKDKFAAAMINHWYVIERGMEIGRLRRHPRSKNYLKLNGAGDLHIEELSKLFSSFSSYTAKNFYANLQHVISEDVEIVGSGAGVKIEFGRVTQRRGMPVSVCIENNSADIQAVIKALNFPEQHPSVKTLLEELPPFSLAEGVGRFLITIPSAKHRISENLAAFEKEVLNSFNTLKSFLKLFQLISVSFTDEIKASVLNDKSVVKIILPNFSNGKVSIERIEVEETETARNQRVLREKLAERLRLRTQSVTSIDLDVEQQKIIYDFSGQDHEPLVLNFDLITNW